MLGIHRVDGGGGGDDDEGNGAADKDCLRYAQYDIYLLHPLDMSQLHVM